MNLDYLTNQLLTKFIKIDYEGLKLGQNMLDDYFIISQNLSQKILLKFDQILNGIICLN